jgi:hypothetical protein
MNNLADNMRNRKEETCLKEFAKITRERISLAVKHADAVFDLFRPQPTALNLKLLHSMIMEDSVLCGFEGGFQGYNPKRKVNREEIFKIHGPSAEFAIKAMQDALFSGVHAGFAKHVFASPADPNNSQEDIKDKIERIIDEDVFGVPHRAWEASVLSFDDVDVVLTIPILTGSAPGAIIVGLNLKKTPISF